MHVWVRSGRIVRRWLGCGLGATIAIVIAGSPPFRASESEAVAPPPAARTGGDGETIDRRLKDLEAQVAELKEEIARLRASLAAAGPAAERQVLAELRKQVEALTLEIERLRIGQAAQPEATGPIGGLGPAASKVYGVKRGVSIGGYGQMLYENFDGQRDDGRPAGRTDRADLERAVFYFGYKFNDRVLFNSEVEFEHAVAGDGEKGEVDVEFAYLDFKAMRTFGVRAGLLLLPVGFINEMHEPPIFLGARRPEVEQLIIPTTWRAHGAGVYGSSGPLIYKVYLTTSLDGTGFSGDEGIREGSGEGSEVPAQNLAFSARVDYAPVPGFLVGASGFSGGVGQGAPGLGHARFSLWEGHAEWNWRGLHARGLYASSIVSDAEAISLAVGGPVGARQRGWYGELGWNVLDGRKGSEQQLILFVRYEDLDTQDRVAPGFMPDPANERTVRTCGASYKPMPQIVLKLDVQNFQNRAGTAVDQLNVALGYLF